MLLKICGMRRQSDLDAAQAAGFDLCGFIFHAESKRYVEPEEAARLETGSMKRVGVFVNAPISEILAIMKTARLDYAQLHGEQEESVSAAIGWQRVIRVLWPDRYNSVSELGEAARDHRCAFYLLDSGRSGGGNGSVLNWASLAGLYLPSPWFLAGGLKESNARMALQACFPHGLDFNSGLEDFPGVKNHQKILAAAAVCRAKEQK